jgi:hypothetical protein
VRIHQRFVLASHLPALCATAQTLTITHVTVIDTSYVGQVFFIEEVTAGLNAA